jgi:hypothetical protein
MDADDMWNTEVEYEERRLDVMPSHRLPPAVECSAVLYSFIVAFYLVIAYFLMVLCFVDMYVFLYCTFFLPKQL